MTPILYSFRRCPYAMRARLALVSAGITCELREVVLRDKPAELIAASPKATVPVLVVGDQVIDESRDIMLWALNRNDPEHWLDMPAEGHVLIDQIEGPFKLALDRYKYASRHPELDPMEQRQIAANVLRGFDARLNGQDWLFGDAPTLADMATITFVRQYAMTDKNWFDAQPWTNLSRWLETFIASPRFLTIMGKYPRWQNGDPATWFPNTLGA
ncbi:hypothetical protein ATO10_08222 [Actibacterium atlanticum]|uniref:Glutathione S-transferase n=1 Tax=Actibacterium atlanticum TaxID=1461693 RepID=A0A058ZNH4_9RHOB|nr:glutathione S-transferase [Actibacterium atlanticum]KCV82361.1 hypothetical protein ATO10_08222 [Actibacterium atlanticum]